MTIAEGIAALKLALDAGSKALDLLKFPKIDADAVRTEVRAMQDHVFSSQRALSEAEEENRQLRLKLDAQERFKSIEGDMEFRQDGDFFIRKSERDAGRVIPYCPTCLKKDRLDIPLEKSVAPGTFRCRVHGHTFTTRQHGVWQKSLFTGLNTEDENGSWTPQ